MKKNFTKCLFVGLSKRKKALLIMKNFLILIFLFNFQVMATNSFSQKTITLDLKDISLKTCIKEIEQQVNLGFLYNSKDLGAVDGLDVYYENASIEEVLNDLLLNNGFGYEIQDEVILIMKSPEIEKTGEIETPHQAAPDTISGIVKDADGRPFPFVTIYFKENLQVGTTSKDDGTYQLIRPDESLKTIVFSFVGMKTVEMPVGSSNVIDVDMEADFFEMDEVLVIAYGTTKKESFTGAASSLSETKITQTQSPNASQALQGNVSGVEISQTSGSYNSATSIRIRGIGSINASSEPLIVVDGVPYGNNLNTINTQDIETMTVLKDAAAAAIYGSRAANGAIIITTKRGSEGKSRIEFTANFGFTSKAIKNYETVGAGDYYELMWEGLRNAYASAGESNPEELASANLGTSLVYNPFSLNQPVGLDGKIKSDAQLLWQTDWAKEVYQTGNNQEYGLSYSGGDENESYYMSLGYSNYEGILTSSDYERFTARIDWQKELTSWLKTGVNMSGSNSKNNEPIGQEGFYNSLNYMAIGMSAIYPVYLRDAQGNFILDESGGNIYDYGVNGDADGRPQRPYWAMPGLNYLGSELYDKNTSAVNQASLRTFLEFKFTEGLKFRTSLSYDLNYISNHIYLNPVYGQGAITNGFATRSENNTNVFNFNNILTYDKVFNKHTLGVLAGQESYSWNNTYLTATKTNFDFENMYELAAGSIVQDANSWEDNYRIASFFTRVNYDYASRYYLSMSYRTDGSSRFHPDSRWGNFWSIGGSWRIIEEEFLKSQQDWLSNLRLRLSYGTLGNDRLGTYYAYQQLYSTGHNNLDQPGVQVSRLGTPDLTWEVSKTTNLGIDFGLFNVLEIELDFFQRKVNDMLFARPLPLSAGIASIDENIGDMQNTGIEFSIFAKAIDNKNFKWFIEFNGTHYKNKITRMVQDEILAGFYKYEVGGSAYDFNIKEWAGVDSENGDPLYYINAGDSERETTNSWFSANKTTMGTALPKLYGGFTNTFLFKGIEFSFLFTYKWGGQVYDKGYQFISHSGAYAGLNLSEDVLDRWTPDNPNADIPSMDSYDYNGNITSSRFLFDASYIRLRNLSLAYNLPLKWCAKMHLTNLRVNVIGQNLLTFSHSKGFDPEVGFGSVADFNYPQLKVITIGINATL